MGRVSRRSEEELFIHKWWFNLIAGVVLLGLSGLLLILAADSHRTSEYVLGTIFVLWGLNHAIRGLRYAVDR